MTYILSKIKKPSFNHLYAMKKIFVLINFGFNIKNLFKSIRYIFSILNLNENVLKDHFSIG